MSRGFEPGRLFSAAAGHEARKMKGDDSRNVRAGQTAKAPVMDQEPFAAAESQKGSALAATPGFQTW